jgi:DNA-binding transcriptional MocR family regulator
MAKSYKRRKKGAGRFVQLHEYLMQSEAWASLKPGPRALYMELKRKYNGHNNGRILLSHRDAAARLNVHRNTVGSYFTELEERGFILMRQGPCLGPEGVGQTAHWVLQEHPTDDQKPALRGFATWKKPKS